MNHALDFLFEGRTQSPPKNDVEKGKDGKREYLPELLN